MGVAKHSVGKIREPVMIANHPVTFTPHYLPGVGPRVIVNDSCPGPRNLAPADARLYATHYKIAADEAESMERRARMTTKLNVRN